MFFALLTALFWSGSGICSARSAKALGVLTVNRSRLILALAGLGMTAWILDRACWGPGAWWFVLSGMIGLGMGDIAMYAAYRLLGTRLTILLTQALAVPGAWIVEWLWLRGDPQLHRAPWALLILVGLAIALWPQRGAATPPDRWRGLLFGIGSAAGLAISAVVSRRGYAAEALTGLESAVLRNAGGLAVMLALWPLQIAMIRARRRMGQTVVGGDWRGGWPWLIGAAILGPGVGVACYQLALAEAPSGAVQAVVATTPILVMPLAWLIDGEKPEPRSIMGSLIAVGAVIGMVW
mgnify:CR=1 FL=1